MKNHSVITKSLAILGGLLVWFPLLAPVLLSLLLLISEGIFRFDYLMPAELALSALFGGILLIWVAARAHLRLKIIGWAFGIAIFMLVGGQVLAEVTGLASGAAEPEGWRWWLVIASLALYIGALVSMGIGGLLLIKDLYKPQSNQ